MDAESFALVALNLVPALRGLRSRRLLEVFGSARAALRAGPGAWRRALGSSGPLGRPSPAEVRAELERARRCGARVVTLHDPGYPSALRILADPPLVLYVLGELPAAPGITIVGARQASWPGRSLAAELAGDLARAGLAVISGLARGVDGAAHRGALEAEGASVAVMGCGIDRCYPREHRDLKRTLGERGAVVTELPCGTPPLARHFPARNRLLAAWGLATVVVEAAAHSGALITARLAAELGRDVLAVPGDPRRATSAGSNGLIQEGAGLVQNARDVLAALRLPWGHLLAQAAAAAEADPPAGAEERSVWEAVRGGAGTGAELAAATGLEPGPLQAALSRLEIGGRIRRHGGRWYPAGPGPERPG